MKKILASLIGAGYLFSSLITPVNTAGCETACWGLWNWPIANAQVVRYAKIPKQNWNPGHRGIDIATTVGATVTAPASGVIGFNGNVAGVPIVTVIHGTERSTFQPVISEFPIGTPVIQGEIFAIISPLPVHCVTRTCLHWGVIEGLTTYINPILKVKGEIYLLE